MKQVINVTLDPKTKLFVSWWSVEGVLLLLEKIIHVYIENLMNFFYQQKFNESSILNLASDSGKTKTCTKWISQAFIKQEEKPRINWITLS